MTGTERQIPMEDATAVNPHRPTPTAELCAMEARLCRLFWIAVGVFTALSIIQSLTTVIWVNDSITSVSTLSATHDVVLTTASAQLAVLERDMVRKTQLAQMQEDVRDLKRANDALSGAAELMRRQVETLGNAVNTVSGLTLTLSNKTSAIGEVSSELVQEIRALRDELRERKEQPGGPL